MFRIIQTVHHNDGKDPRRTWYNTAETLNEALIILDMFNQRNRAKNLDQESIPVTYSIEYDPYLAA